MVLSFNRYRPNGYPRPRRVARKLLRNGFTDQGGGVLSKGDEWFAIGFKDAIGPFRTNVETTLDAEIVVGGGANRRKTGEAEVTISIGELRDAVRARDAAVEVNLTGIPRGGGRVHAAPVPVLFEPTMAMHLWMGHVHLPEQDHFGGAVLHLDKKGLPERLELVDLEIEQPADHIPEGRLELEAIGPAQRVEEVDVRADFDEAEEENRVEWDELAALRKGTPAKAPLEAEQAPSPDVVIKPPAAKPPPQDDASGADPPALMEEHPDPAVNLKNARYAATCLRSLLQGIRGQDETWLRNFGRVHTLRDFAALTAPLALSRPTRAQLDREAAELNAALRPLDLAKLEVAVLSYFLTVGKLAVGAEGPLPERFQDLPTFGKDERVLRVLGEEKGA